MTWVGVVVVVAEGLWLFGVVVADGVVINEVVDRSLVGLYL